MQLIATHAGFHAFASQAEDSLEISYRDTEGRDIDKERFPGITDYRLKLEHIEEHRPGLIAVISKELKVRGRYSDRSRGQGWRV